MLTKEQLSARLGKLTASNAGVIMGGLKTDGLEKYVKRLAGERVFGDLAEESYKSAAMERGDEVENDALAYFEFEHRVALRRLACIDHPTIPYVAASPDGIGEDYTVEAKSPLFHNWADTREAWYRGKRGIDAVPSQYRWQCRWQPWCCGFRRGYFVAYHPTSGGIIVPYEITEDECSQMAERVVLVEGLIRNWVEIFQERIAA